MNLIINFAPTGMIPTKAMTPHVPISINETIEDVHQAIDTGITMVHLHARDPNSGKPTYKAEIYEELITGIRKISPDIVICVSLSGRNFNDIMKRAEPLQLTGMAKPDMGSLTLSSLNFYQQASVNSPDTVKALALEMKKQGILPELEVFDIGMIHFAKYLESKNYLVAPHYFNLIFGNIASAQPDFLHIGTMIRDLPKNSIWSLGGIGTSQLKIMSIAIAFGCGVRVGLEDNIWYDSDRKILAKNINLIKRVHQIAELNEREIMPPREFRELLNLYGANERNAHLNCEVVNVN
jgi:uncharacterized protein (DUF849 family)